jgi:hypothetical protein
MSETVTVDEALKKGQRMINYPVFAIQMVGFGVGYYLTTFPAFPQWIALIVFILGFTGAWLYWSFNITKWKLWAFKNVDDVYDLKYRAIKGKLIWPDGSIWEKTEIWSAADKKKWIQLQERFIEYDEFDDSHDVH